MGERVLKIRILGAGREVGRAGILVEYGGTRILLDYGAAIDTEPAFPLHVAPKTLDAVFLSHAHLDHSGALPMLYVSESRPLYATPLTLELSEILIRDFLKISKYYVPYEVVELESMLSSAKLVRPGDVVEVGEIEVEVVDAGHIPGSAMVLLEVEEEGETKRVLYTGDVKTSDTRLLKAAQVPKADILLCESTYGDRFHPDRAEMENSLLEGVESTLGRGGNAVVASFALGRTQELLLILKDLGYPVYLDGMGGDLTKLMLQYPRYLRDVKALKKAVEDVIWVEHNGMRKQAVKEPSIIVSTAGMLTGGPIIYYLKKLQGDARSTIFLTGYQVEETNGRLLMDKGFIVDPRSGRRIDIGLDVRYLDFSAHDGRRQLEQLVKDVDPGKCFLLHGDPASCESFGEFTSQVCESFIPELNSAVEV